MGRVTHFYVKEGDKVRRARWWPPSRTCSRKPTSPARRPQSPLPRPTSQSYIAAEKTAQANLEHAQADLEQKKLDWDRAQALYKDGIMAKQDYDANKAAYDLDVADVAQADAQLNQAKANTDSARGHMHTQEADLQGESGYATTAPSPSRPLTASSPTSPLAKARRLSTGIQNTEGSTLMTIADMSVITAEVKVDETDIVNVQLGQPADVTVDALPDKVFKGHVT